MLSALESKPLLLERSINAIKFKFKFKPLHKGMAETDISHEFGREPGFSRSIFVVFDPASSHMLHIVLF